VGRAERAEASDRADKFEREEDDRADQAEREDLAEKEKDLSERPVTAPKKGGQPTFWK
jgi:hypothetical protein